MNILITCPPMIKQIGRYDDYLKLNNFTYFCPEFNQIMKEEDLIKLLPDYDAWIIGDDPTNYNILSCSKRLKVCIKWGVGVDNIDYASFKKLGIHIDNTPGVFGNEVADIVAGYLLMLSRELHTINNKIRNENIWYKPTGISLTNKKVCLVGFGDIGRNVTRRLVSFGMDVHISDPGFYMMDDKIKCKYANMDIRLKATVNGLDYCLEDADFIVITCALNDDTKYLINKENILKAKKGVRIINVSRGAVVKEDDVIELLESGHIDSVAFDVFETEPIEISNKLRNYEKNIFGSHNGSNTIEAVDKTSFMVIDKIVEFNKKQ